MELTASPVKRRALESGLEVLQPERARDPELRARLEQLRPDVATVVAYGKILPAELLAVPALGFVNVHFSLLPAYRGAAPVQRALMDGVSETGVSIMVLTEGMDEGPILARERVEVTAHDTAGSLGDRLARVGARLLVPALEGYATGALDPVPQDHASATYAPKLSAEEARVDWNRPGGAIRNLVRALNPEPGAWTTFRGVRMKLYDVRPVEGAGDLTPGEIDARSRLVVGTGDIPVAVVEAQLAGKRRMSGNELARGLRIDGGRLE